MEAVARDKSAQPLSAEYNKSIEELKEMAGGET